METKCGGDEKEMVRNSSRKIVIYVIMECFQRIIEESILNQFQY